MKKLNNKGFTIVELVIVVAVIAILAAVLIPTIGGLIKTAQTSADVTLVKNVNLILATERATEGKNVTMQDALDDALEGGYDITKLSPTNSDNLILWDQDSDNFVLYANGKYNNAGTDIDLDNIVPSRLWNISETTEGSSHSVYYIGTETTVTVNGVGFDAGNSKVATVNYTSSVANTVLINTNGGTLNVGAEGAVAKGTIYHNGTLAAANVYTESNSFHTSGKIASLNLYEGKAVVENGAYVGLTAAAEGTSVEEKGGLFYVADETNINANVLATLDNGTDRSYKIGSKAELIEFRNAWNSGALATGTFTLTTNIDISGEEWLPIGTWEHPFNGTFNGNGKTISGLTKTQVTVGEGYDVYGSSTGYGQAFGLFGIVGGGDVEVKNLTLSNVEISLADSGKDVGAVIGYAPKNADFVEDSGLTTVPESWGKHKVTLTGVTVSGAVSANSHVGGMIGKFYSTGDITFTDCVNNATVTAKDARAGGFVATIQYNKATNFANFTNCTNTGAVSGGDYAGGIVAYSVTADNTFVGCTNSGNVYTTGMAGGLIGTAGNPDNPVILDNCANSGYIYGSKSAGGLIGSTATSTTKSYARITLENAISNTGKVESAELAGGLICARSESGGGWGYIYESLTIDTDAENIKATGEVIVAEGGVSGTYWIFNAGKGWYYCDSATTEGTLAE